MKWLSLSALWALVYNMQRAKQQLRPLVLPALHDALPLAQRHLDIERRAADGLTHTGTTTPLPDSAVQELALVHDIVTQIETLLSLFEG